MTSKPYTINLLGAFATKLASDIEANIQVLGLRSTSAATALVTIGNHPDDSIDVLGKILGLTHSGAVRLVNGLEEDGFVRRHKSSDDARAVVIRLTREGRSQAAAVLRAREEATQSVYGSLSEAQRSAIVPILETVLGDLTSEISDARKICRLCDEGVCRPQGCPVETASHNR